MKIGAASHHSPVPPAQQQELHTQPKKKDTATDPPRDWVEISDTARQQLAEMADRARQEHVQMAGGAEDTVTVEEQSNALRDGRLEQIRLKILSGFYNSYQVTDRIASRLSDEIEEL
jgi:anti-sigma28 factor (negative regulator of flagellin synthesis)